MLKSKMLTPRTSPIWADHNARVARNEAIHKELEKTFPHKFRHPKIGRLWMARGPKIIPYPAIEIHQVAKAPRWIHQFWLGVLIVVAFLGASFAFAPL